MFDEGFVVTFLLVRYHGFLSVQVREEDGDEGIVDVQRSTIKSLSFSNKVCMYMCVYVCDNVNVGENESRDGMGIEI